MALLLALAGQEMDDLVQGSAQLPRAHPSAAGRPVSQPWRTGAAGRPGCGCTLKRPQSCSALPAHPAASRLRQGSLQCAQERAGAGATHLADLHGMEQAVSLLRFSQQVGPRLAAQSLARRDG